MTGRTREECERRGYDDGFTLVEMAVAAGVMIVALAALAGVMVLVSHQREQVSVRNRVLAAAESVMEEIKGINPQFIEDAYDDRTYPVEDVQGAGPDNSALSVDVDSSNPNLLVVTVAGSWFAAGNNENLVLRTDIYSP